MKVRHPIAVHYAAVLLGFAVWSDTAQAEHNSAHKGKISRNVYRIPYANTQTLTMGANSNYYKHKGSMDTVSIGRVCTAAAATVCVTNSDCASVGGTCQGGFCIQICTSNANCDPGGGQCDYVIVAPADGLICWVIEHYNDCGCNGPAFGPYGNVVMILHANGERSGFLHVKQWSPMLFGITPDMFVSQGQPIAIEGDVGNTCGGTTARTGTCLEKPDVPPDVPPMACKDVFPFVACTADTNCDGGVCTSGTCVGGLREGKDCTSTDDCNPKCKSTGCGRHIHWSIARYTTGELVNPFTCGIPGNIYKSGDDQKSPCGTEAPSYNDDENLTSADSLSGFEKFKVIQAHNTITVSTPSPLSTLTVKNHASLVLHAGNRITLQPSFRVLPDGYFRAEIADPDKTAPSSWSAPNSCPCTGAVGFCYERSDPTSADGVEQLCPTPGPQKDQCHGCPGISGGQRCCPCVTNGTCQ